MYHHEDLDDQQQENYIRPIFESLIKQNIDIGVIEKLFFDSNTNMFFKYLPDTLKNDNDFLKKCIQKNLVYFDDIPQALRTHDLISKQDYINMITHQLVEFKENFYPQDKEIVMALCQNSYNYYEFQQIDKKFFNDKDVIHATMKQDLNFLLSQKKDLFKNKETLYQAIKLNANVLYQIPKEQANEMIENKETLKELISLNVNCFQLLAEEDRYKSEYLLLILKNPEGLKIAKDYLYKNKDADVALNALKIDKTIAKYLNQKFWSAIKKNNAKENPYDFLKSYTEKDMLEKNINLAPKTAKVKI